MSGEGFIPSRSAGAPHEHSRMGGRPGVVSRLCADGEHRVCLVLATDGCSVNFVVFDPDTAERIGRELLQYSALVRDKIGLEPRGEEG